jgi:integrase/recombinase XerC
MWRTPLAAWLGSLIAAGQTQQTIASRRQQLSCAARALGPDPWSVTSESLAEYATAQDWSRETRRTNYAALRGFYRWAVVRGHIDCSPAAQLPRVKAADPCPRPAPEMVYATAKAYACRRTLLILRLAGETGMRRAEIAQVHSDDLSADLLGHSLMVHGKGGKLRMVPLPDDLAAAIAHADGWLFPGDDHGHLSPRWVGKLAAQALSGKWTLHTLRHRFATKAYAGRDLLAVQQLLGHSSPATTQRYIATDAHRMRTAAALAS